MNKLTIFTPTYNRAKILPNLYKSLQLQTNKHFTWLIVDDGSIDDTEKLVKMWIKQSDFEIKYYKKENGGKNTAIDFANNVCTTSYITCFDSDDVATKDCVDTILNKIKVIDSDDDCAGIVSLRIMVNDSDDIAKKSKRECTIESEEIASYSKLNEWFGYYPETIIILKTEIAKKFSFPKISSEKFITEGVYYNQIFRNYNVLFIKEKFYITEYLDDGYTALKMDVFFKNPKGYIYFLKQNAYFSILDKQGFFSNVKNCGIFYAWKTAFNVRDDFKKDYKIKFPYNLLGNLSKLIILGKCKKAYKNYLKK